MRANNANNYAGINYKLAAKLISNIKNIDRFNSADKMARYAGLIPSEYSSGKSRKVALTCLQRRLVDIIYAMMRDRSAYKLPEIPDYKVLNKAG